MSTIDHTRRITLARYDEARPGWSLHMEYGTLTLNIWGRDAFHDYKDDAHFSHNDLRGFYDTKSYQCRCGEILSADEWSAPLPEVNIDHVGREQDLIVAVADGLTTAAKALTEEAWPQWIEEHGAYGSHEDEETGKLDVAEPMVYYGDIADALSKRHHYWSIGK